MNHIFIYPKSLKKNILLMFSLILLYPQLKAQQSYKILQTTARDSLSYHAEQQIKRFKNDNTIHADSMMQAGLMIYQRGEMDYARQFFELAYKKQEQTNDRQGMARSNSNIAVMFELKGQYDKALECDFHSLKIFESLKDTLPEIEIWQNVTKVYSNIGVLYNELKDFENGIKYLKISLEYDGKIINFFNKNPELGNKKNAMTLAKQGLAYTFNDIAYYWENSQKKNIDSALVYYQKGYNLLKEINSAYQYLLKSNIGIIYVQKGNYKKAIPMLEDTYNEALQNNSELSLPSVYHHLSYAYIKTGRYKKAHKLLDEGLDFSRKNKMLNDEFELIQDLYLLNTAKKNYKQANINAELLLTMKDSILNKQKNDAIAEHEVKYNTERKEYEAKIAKEQLQLEQAEFSRKQQIYVIIALIFILIVAITIFLFWRKSIKDKHDQVVLKQQLLRAQMNPHFIFNTLGSIQNYMMQNNAQLASSYLSKFSKLTRDVLESSDLESITLETEIDILRNYIELEQMRLNNNFEFELNYSDELEIEFIHIPPILVQPFVENAIKHGFALTEGSEKKWLLKLEITDKNDFVEFIIEDNGRGMVSKDSKNSKHKSMAMDIFEKRRKIIQAKQKKNFKYELINIGDKTENQTGVKVILNIPIIGS